MGEGRHTAEDVMGGLQKLSWCKEAAKVGYKSSDHIYAHYILYRP